MRIRRFPPIEDRTPEMATNRPKMGPKGPKLGQNGQNGHNGHNGPRRFAGFPLYCRFAPICRFPPLYWRFAPICWFSPVFTDLLVSSYIAGLRRFAGFPYIAGFRRFAGFPPYIGASRRFAGFPLYCRFSPISRLSRGSRGQFRQIRSRMRFFFWPIPHHYGCRCSTYPPTALYVVFKPRRGGFETLLAYFWLF